MFLVGVVKQASSVRFGPPHIWPTKNRLDNSCCKADWWAIFFIFSFNFL